MVKGGSISGEIMSLFKNCRTLGLVAVAAALSVQFTLAQEAFDSAPDSTRSANATNPAFSPTPSLAPILPGATNGTIGPPGADAMVVSGGSPRGAVVLNVLRYPAEWFAVPLTALLLFFLVRRKRASFWELGLVTSVIVGTTGLAWGLLLVPH